MIKINNTPVKYITYDNKDVKIVKKDENTPIWAKPLLLSITPLNISSLTIARDVGIEPTANTGTISPVSSGSNDYNVFYGDWLSFSVSGTPPSDSITYVFYEASAARQDGSSVLSNTQRSYLYWGTLFIPPKPTLITSNFTPSSGLISKINFDKINCTVGLKYFSSTSSASVDCPSNRNTLIKSTTLLGSFVIGDFDDAGISTNPYIISTLMPVFRSGETVVPATLKTFTNKTGTYTITGYGQWVKGGTVDYYLNWSAIGSVLRIITVNIYDPIV